MTACECGRLFELKSVESLRIYTLQECCEMYTRHQKRKARFQHRGTGGVKKSLYKALELESNRSKCLLGVKISQPAQRDIFTLRAEGENGIKQNLVCFCDIPVVGLYLCCAIVSNIANKP